MSILVHWNVEQMALPTNRASQELRSDILQVHNSRAIDTREPFTFGAIFRAVNTQKSTLCNLEVLEVTVKRR